jgi:hypothetical protein
MICTVDSFIIFGSIQHVNEQGWQIVVPNKNESSPTWLAPRFGDQLQDARSAMG